MSYYTLLKAFEPGLHVSFNWASQNGESTPELVVTNVHLVDSEQSKLRVDLDDPVNGRRYSVEAQDNGEEIFISEVTEDGTKWYSEVLTIEVIGE